MESNGLRVLRQRWISIVVAAFSGLAVAAGFTFFETPQYKATSLIFASVKGDTSSTDILEGNAFAESRVISYVTLATSPRMLQAVADELGLDKTGRELAGKIEAASPPQTVLLNITATDPQAEQAAKIADATARQLIRAVAETEDASLINLRIFANATPATSPSTPRVSLNLSIGFVLGLLFGLLTAILRQVVDTRIRQKGDVDGIVSAAVLGTFAKEAALEKEPLFAHGDQHSRRAESFRRLRTRLRCANRGAALQTVVVSSSIHSEGKTSTSVNLAIVLAESGTKVLLVDADLRRPGVARYLGLEESIGLSGVLSNSVALEDAVQGWGTGGALKVLPSGRAVPNPIELFSSPSMKELMSRFEDEFEVVIMDAPPLVPVADSAMLGTIASGVLLVVSADGRTHRSHLSQAVASLEAANARVLGLVINKLDGAGSMRSYYDYPLERIESGK